MPPNSFSHVQQIGSGYCLPACAEMALAQLGIQASQTELAKIFETRLGLGTPFSNIQRMEQWPVKVEIFEWGGLEVIQNALVANNAIIVALLTTPALSGWNDFQTQHTILIVEVTIDGMFYHDPALPQGPVMTSHEEFLLAWSEMDEKVALVRLL